MATVVTAHRMAFATSGTRTVLWDQIKYAGNPTDFSWVLPVKGAVKIESASDAWFEALEAVTNAQVSPPPLHCFNQSSSGGDGCSCGAASASDVALAPTSAGAGNPSTGVTVTHEGTVGPYDCVQVEGGGQALADWLPKNGYVVPPDMAPVLDAYANEGFGFIALKLQPDQGTKQMTPVRVITDGGSDTLPLRMVAAGTGDFVAITLYVIAEGRYEIDGFGQTAVDTSKLAYDWSNSNTNYADVRQQALAANGGKVWLTSFSQLDAFTQAHTDAVGNSLVYSVNKGGAGGGFPGGGFGAPTFTNLTDLYFAQAESDVGATDSCSGSGYSSRLTSSGMVYDDCRADGSTDGGAQPPMGMCGSPPGNCTPPATGGVPSSSLSCNGHSDIAAAMIGMHPNTVWVTRLESNLPRESLAADLKIKPSVAQEPVSNTMRAAVHVNPPCDLLENHPEVTTLRQRSQQAGVGLVSGLALFFARRLRRRKDHELS
jgi:hypothetical protein